MQHIYHHITEIKLRFIYSIFSLIITLLVSYIYQLELLYIITRPFLKLQQKFIFVDLTEALYTIIRICIYISIMLIIPYIIYQIWSFFIPSCYLSERNAINKFLIIFIILLCLEIFIIYFLLFPKICEFLLSFQINNPLSSTFEKGISTLNLDKNQITTSSLVIVELSARIESYVKLIIRLLIFILFFFQLPFFFVILYYNKICTGYDLCLNRKFIFFLCILFSAFISPPDIFSQSLIILFFIFIFEFLIFLGLIFQQKFENEII